MGGKSKSQTTQQSSSTAPPDWVTEAYQSLVNNAQQTGNQAYKAYEGDRVAPLTSEQEAGIAATMAAAGKADPFYSKAGGYLDQSAQSISPMAFSNEALQKFMNPHQQAVVDATLAQTAENDRRQQQDLTGNAIMQGAWGGDRAGVAKAELGRQQKLAADTTLAGLNSQNFSQALQTFQQQQGVDLGARQNDASRQANAGTSFMNLGKSAQDSALKDAYAQIQAGSVRQENQQKQADADYEAYQNEQSYPFLSQGWLANLLTGVGSGSGSTTSGTTTGRTNGGSNAGSYAGAGISLLSALFSDERLKEDVEQVGETFDGQPIYRYRMIGDPRTQIGLMAQDVEDVHPEAVGDIGGVKMVDYAAATDDAARGGYAEGGVVVPYTGRVKSIVPDTRPIKGRTGLMASQNSAPGSGGSGGTGDSGGGDYGKMGGQIGSLLKNLGTKSGSAFDIGSIGFAPTSAGASSEAFSGDMGGMGAVYARGGVVPPRRAYADGGVAALFDPEPMGGVFSPYSEPVADFADSAPAWRSARAGGNPLHTAENEDETRRLERALGMVTMPEDRDAIIRTVFGEAASEPAEGKRAVASVIKNRAVESGVAPADVVRAKGQFEPWMTEAGIGRMQGMSPTKFEQTAKELSGVFKNLDDPTGGATHFYAPKAQAALGRNAPRWDDGTGTDIGNHRFFDIGYGGGLPGGGGVAAARMPSAAPAGIAAAAYAPDDGNSVSGRTTAFDGLRGDGVAADTSSGGPGDVGQGGGVAGGGQRAAPGIADADKGFGLGYLPKDVQLALIAAGLGMMGSRGHSAGQQIGEGALAGLQFYTSAQAGRSKSAADERDRARKTLVEDRSFGLEEKKHQSSLMEKAQALREKMAKGEIREVNGRLVTVNPYSGDAKDVTPPGLPSGARPMTAEERLAYGVKEGGAYIDATGKPGTLGGGGAANKILAEIEERKAGAASIGLKPTDPRYETYILTGKTPREDAQPLSATDKKAILEADEGVLAAETAIGALKEAKTLSKKAYEGPTAGLRGKVTGVFGDESGLATSELNNLVATNALSQLKAIFGAAPTEGERKILMEIQGAADQPDALRQKIFDRAISMAEKRLTFNRQRAEEMRGGSFYKKPEGKAAAPQTKTDEPAKGQFREGQRARNAEGQTLVYRNGKWGAE